MQGGPASSGKGDSRRKDFYLEVARSLRRGLQLSTTRSAAHQRCLGQKREGTSGRSHAGDAVVRLAGSRTTMRRRTITGRRVLERCNDDIRVRRAETTRGSRGDRKGHEVKVCRARRFSHERRAVRDTLRDIRSERGNDGGRSMKRHEETESSSKSRRRFVEDARTKRKRKR